MSKIPELTEQFLAAADIEAETQIGIGPITHIPANDWAAIGARLERCDEFKVEKGEFARSFYATILWGNRFFTKRGKTPLEALTAALDAAEGKK